jgi:hypothetical protein
LFYPGNEMERGREEREGVCDGESDCDSEWERENAQGTTKDEKQRPRDDCQKHSLLVYFVDPTGR